MADSAPTSDYQTAQSQTNGSTEPAEPLLPSLQPRKKMVLDEIVLPTEVVAILGKQHEMLSMEHLGNSDNQKILLHWGAVTEVSNRIKDDPLLATAEDDAEVVFRYDQIFSVIIPTLSTEDKARLTPNQKARLFVHFLDFQEECRTETAVGEGRMTRAEAIAALMAYRSTGDTGSPSSAASTEPEPTPASGSGSPASSSTAS